MADSGSDDRRRGRQSFTPADDTYGSTISLSTPPRQRSTSPFQRPPLFGPPIPGVQPTENRPDQRRENVGRPAFTQPIIPNRRRRSRTNSSSNSDYVNRHLRHGRPESPKASSVYDVDSDRDDFHDNELPPEWVQPKTSLEDGTATELLVAHSIEHRISKSGAEKIVLVCPSAPPPSTRPRQEKAQEQFRWLWVCNSTTPSLDKRKSNMLTANRHVQQNTCTNDVEHAFRTLEVSSHVERSFENAEIGLTWRTHKESRYELPFYFASSTICRLVTPPKPCQERRQKLRDHGTHRREASVSSSSAQVPVLGDHPLPSLWATGREPGICPPFVEDGSWI